MFDFVLNVHSKQLRSCWNSDSYPNHSFPGQAQPKLLTSTQCSPFYLLLNLQLVKRAVPRNQTPERRPRQATDCSLQAGVSQHFYCEYFGWSGVEWSEVELVEFFFLVWVEALHPSQQFFSHVGTKPPLPGYYQYFLGGKCILLKDTTRRPK